MFGWLKKLFGKDAPPPPKPPAVTPSPDDPGGPVWMPRFRSRAFGATPTRAWWDGSAKMGYAGRLVQVGTVERDGQEVPLVRPLRWFKERSRQRRRSGPKVVRDDSE